MHRRPLLDLLAAYRAAHASDPAEVGTADRVRALVEAHPDCFERSCPPGHVTGSAWIVSEDGGRVLLTHHRKLDRWLQLGGHADGDPDPLSVALREAREESGLVHLRVVPAGALGLPLDIDVHPIPARGGEPAHEHHDVRFLLVADARQALVLSEESRDLRWVALDDLRRLAGEPGILRMDRKARLLLGLPPP